METQIVNAALVQNIFLAISLFLIFYIIKDTRQSKKEMKEDFIVREKKAEEQNDKREIEYKKTIEDAKIQINKSSEIIQKSQELLEKQQKNLDEMSKKIEIMDKIYCDVQEIKETLNLINK